MNEFFLTHRKTKWAGIILLALLLVAVLLIEFFDWNLLRPALARTVTARTGRPASIDGDLKVHPWSLTPRAEVNELRIMNPGWAEQNLMFGAKRITISVSLLRLLRGQLVLPQVDLVEPVINLERDSKGRASWELGTTEGRPNHDTKPVKLPTVRSLTIENGKLHVDDKIRKLRFSGTLVAAEQEGHQNASAFQIRSSGSLNDRPFRLDANGGPLFNLEPSKPYEFEAKIAASDINLEAQVNVLKPFDLSDLDVKFALSGHDLADVYYLTGLALPNTPDYHLAATVHERGTVFTIDDLQGRLGTSDLSGNVQIQTAGSRPKLTAKLSSVTLNMADLEPMLGHPTNDSLSMPKAASATAAAKSTPSAASSAEAGGVASPLNTGPLLSDANLQLNRVRGMDADVTYRAASVAVPKVPMKEVSFHLLLDNGLLTMDPLSFVLDRGKFKGRVQIDARSNIPVSDIDMRADSVDLSQFKSAAKPAPLEGTLVGRLKVRGRGTSIHKFAASSEGGLSVVIPHGQISDAMAELTGINVISALGLMISKKQTQTEIRCGIVDFKDQQGKLNTTTVYVDTSNVLITGRGNVNLDDEHLDLAFQGDPKKLRLLRLRAPITLHGTLRHPAVGIKVGKLAEQAGVATALAALLTPVAAAIAFIDPGLAKNKDCSTVLEQANAGVQNYAQN